jgi:hypothetical protein
MLWRKNPPLRLAGELRISSRILLLLPASMNEPREVGNDAWMVMPDRLRNALGLGK